MSQPGQQPQGQPDQPTYARAKSVLEEYVDDLQLGWVKYKSGSADAPPLAELEELIALLIKTELTDTDRRVFGPMRTVAERVDMAVRAEPYRTMMDRAGRDNHDKRRRRLAYSRVLVPLHEKAVEAAITDLSSLCRLRRRTG